MASLDFSGMVSKLFSSDMYGMSCRRVIKRFCGKSSIMDDIQTQRRWFSASLLCTGLVLAGMGLVSVNGPLRGQENKSISVRVVDKAGYDKVIASNKGKVIVVDCWATWCNPCRKAFPKTVELSKAYAGQGIVVVSLSFDKPVKDQAPEAVKRFLALNDAHFENLVSSLDLSEEGAEAFEITDGALPHFKVYGKDGKLFKIFESHEDNELKHEEIEAAVKGALKGKSTSKSSS